LLEEASDLTGTRGCTWSDFDEKSDAELDKDCKGYYSDPLTLATREEFDFAEFQPRAACRRAKSSGKQRPQRD
jgi:hypothetical protein